MYSGVPSIRLEGDKAECTRLIPRGKALLARTQEFVNKAEVTSFSLTEIVDENSYIYTLVLGSQNLIFISSYPTVTDEETPPEKPITLPTYFDFYSGVVVGGNLENKTVNDVTFQICTDFYPTIDCRNQRDELIALGKQDVSRLAVRPYGAFTELFAPSVSSRSYSQYRLLRPSMYSGLMQSVVQLVMGYGVLTEKGQAKPIQIQYDYKFFRCHGITKSVDGTLWLVEISATRGVCVMPLPVVKNTSELYYRAIARNDNSMVTAIETLGVLPTGEIFPTSSKLFYEEVEKGNILRLLKPDEMEGFYSHTAFSPNLGWAFSPTGNEAHNTAYSYNDDGFQFSVWYQINISIGPIKPFRKENEPIAVASASISRQNWGYLYAPPVKGAGRYIKAKFYNGLIEEKGIYSHDAAPTVQATGKKVPLCDAPIFVTFINGTLRVAKFYSNRNGKSIDEVDDSRSPGECLYGNSWTITRRWGRRDFPTMVYTNDHDDRRMLQERTESTLIKSIDLGYDPPIVSDFIQALDHSFIYRVRVFKKEVTRRVSGGEHIGSVFVVPGFCREAYYYAYKEGFSEGVSVSHSVSYDSLRDPNVGYGWRKFIKTGPSPWPRTIGCSRGSCGGDHSERRLVCTHYVRTACSDFADNGRWLTPCEILDFYMGAARPVRNPSSWSDPLDYKYKATLSLEITGHMGTIDIPIEYSTIDSTWENASPDYETGVVQNIFATHSALGEPSVGYETNIGAASVLHKGHLPPFLDETLGCFVGVNS